ncbi:MAG: ATP-binding protein [Nitrospira sp.]|nr:ATP-binding protein [Nitrospira sp.]
MNQETWNSVDELHQTGLSYDWYYRTSKWLAATVALIVVLVLVGWTFHINRLTRLSPDFTAMKVTTAIGLLFLAGALLLLNQQIIRPDSSGTRVRNGVVFVLATMAGLLGLGTLLGYAIPEAVRFAVRDSVLGIALEDQTCIFDEFVQLRHPLQQRIGGQGLGLALCKRLADVLGAIIWVLRG